MQSYERKVERHPTAGIASAESTPDLHGGCQSRQAEAVATTTSYPALERRREPRILTNDAASMLVLNRFWMGDSLSGYWTFRGTD